MTVTFMRAAVLIAGIALPGCIVIALTAQAAPAGTISLVEKSPVPFPVLINGRRVMVAALRAAGQLRHPMGVRPWEVYVLDHPEQPILLEVAYGAPGRGDPDGARSRRTAGWRCRACTC